MPIPWRKPTVRDLVLFALLSVLDGAGAARVLYAYIGEYLKIRREKYAPVRVEQQAFYTALNRLKRDGLVERQGKFRWRLTRHGLKAAKQISRHLGYTDSRASVEASERNVMVVFDIPERWRARRDDLRAELIALRFELLQKSVWMGSGPLPQAFLEYLRDQHLLPYVHLFTVQKAGTLK